MEFEDEFVDAVEGLERKPRNSIRGKMEAENRNGSAEANGSSVKELNGSTSVYLDNGEGLWKCRHCLWDYRVGNSGLDHIQKNKEHYLDMKSLSEQELHFRVQFKGLDAAGNFRFPGLAMGDIVHENTEDLNSRNAGRKLNSLPLTSEGYRETGTAGLQPILDIIDAHAQNGTLQESKLEIGKIDVERVLEEQDTHDLYCPNCRSCITKRVILRKRKRTIHDSPYDEVPEIQQDPYFPDSTPTNESSEDKEPEVFRCLQCFSFFTVTGSSWNCLSLVSEWWKEKVSGNGAVATQVEIGANSNPEIPFDKLAPAPTGAVATQVEIGANSNPEIPFNKLPPAPAEETQGEIDSNFVPGNPYNELSSAPEGTMATHGEINGNIILDKPFIVPPSMPAGATGTHGEIDGNIILDKPFIVPPSVPAGATVTQREIDTDFMLEKPLWSIPKGGMAKQGEIVANTILEKPFIVLPSVPTDGKIEAFLIPEQAFSKIPSDPVGAAETKGEIDADFINEKPLNEVSSVPEGGTATQGEVEANIILEKPFIVLPSVTTEKKRRPDDRIVPVIITPADGIVPANITSMEPLPNEGQERETIVDMAEVAEPGLAVQKVGEATEYWDILKSIVYGGLAESITSVGVVSSTAGADASTLSIVALGLANLIGGLFVIANSLWELRIEGQASSKQEKINQSDVTNKEEKINRYEETLGKVKNFRLHATMAVLSYIVFGAVPPIVYGFSFRKSYNKDYKLIAVAIASVLCIALLAIGKARAGREPRSYLKTISYYVGLGVAASGLSYAMGDLVKELLVKLGWITDIAAAPTSSDFGFLDLGLVASSQRASY